MSMRSLATGPVLLGLAVLAATAARADERPTGKQDLARELRHKGWIAYSARTDRGDWDLFLIRPDGSDVRNITDTPEYSEAAPRFSYDGKRLLYRRFEPDARIDHDRWGFQGQVVIANGDGSDPRPVGKDRELPWATWSPDGKQVACLELKGIKVVNLETLKTVRRIPRLGMYQQLGWSPDGKWFCGVSNRFGENWTVVRMSAGGKSVNPVNAFQNCTPDWLPDSKRIIFSHRPGNQEGYGWTQLWIADGDGKNRRLLYGQDGRHIYGGCTSPDMQYVLFTACEQDGGGSEKSGAPMQIIRYSEVPIIHGESKALRRLHPKARDAEVLTLPAGWEPHWTFAEVIQKKPAENIGPEGSEQ